LSRTSRIDAVRCGAVRCGVVSLRVCVRRAKRRCVRDDIETTKMLVLPFLSRTLSIREVDDTTNSRVVTATIGSCLVVGVVGWQCALDDRRLVIVCVSLSARGRRRKRTPSSLVLCSVWKGAKGSSLPECSERS
jgi:hypothetical protein